MSDELERLIQELLSGKKSAAQDDAVREIKRPSLDDNEDFVPDEWDIPSEVPILPLRGLVVYPQTAIPLTVGQPRSVRLVDDVVNAERLVGLVTAHNPEQEKPGPDEVYRIGTLATIHRLFRAPDGTIRLLVQGLSRIRVTEFTGEEPYLKARILPYDEDLESDDLQLEALVRNVTDQFRALADLMPSIPTELVSSALSVDDPLQLVYSVATYVRIDLDDAQKLLEIDSVSQKLRFLLELLNKEVEVLELGRKIQTEAQSEMEKTQREYYLREQLKAIQRELSEGDEQLVEIEQFRNSARKSRKPR
jgi:ATP-dependent Lon protease